jgi:hypothetical protein
MYHRHAAAKATFSLIDSHIWHMLWRWAVRRHPAKGARWVIRRYFRVRGSRSWAFVTKGSADGKTVGLQLFCAMTVAITRHVKGSPVWRQTADQAGEEEHQVLAGQGPGGHQRQHQLHAGAADTATQSGHPWLGHVSPSHRGESSLHAGGSPHLATALELGNARHPNKGARWVKDRYFPTNGSRKWSFATKGSAKGKTVGVELFRASTAAIIRHIKVRATANPFDRGGRILRPSSSLETSRWMARCQSMVLKKGLSRMQGDLHVRFLGGGGTVMCRCYPTRTARPGIAGRCTQIRGTEKPFSHVAREPERLFCT